MKAARARRSADAAPAAAAPAASDDSIASEAARRHLEDRERLLFVSRSVSVGEMATTLAHEINQPIGTVTNVLRGVLAWLDQREASSATELAAGDSLAELRQGVRLALDQALFAARIVGRIREFTQSRQPNREPVDVHALLRTSVALLDWEVARALVDVRLDFARLEPPPQVLGDAVMLQQVIVNLLRNAVDALGGVEPAQRRIVVATRLHRAPAAPARIEIEVRDTGCGLTAGDEERLFVPFQSSKPTGMGVGLNICRSFVEMHQGRLWFTRAAAGEGGCSFHVELPLVS
jgi:two-component system, LuxR family, sensor kinase FixL